MTKEEFIHYTRGVIDSEIEKARIEMLGLPQPSEGQLVGPLKLIKDALDKVNINEPNLIPGYKGPILTNPCSNEPDEVPYNEICPCNPKNGGGMMGVCGCSMPNKMVPNPKKYSGYTTTITSTGTDIKIN